jgi:hypothetical protein
LDKPLSLSSAEIENWVNNLVQQFSHLPGVDELMSRIAKDEMSVKALMKWLDELTKNV